MEFKGNVALACGRGSVWARGGLWKSIVAAVLICAPVVAQEFKLPAGLESLAAKASEVVDVTLDSSLLQLASKFLADNNADDVKVKKLVTGLKGVWVRSFQFDKTGEYQASDVELVRSQARGPGWSRIVGVRSHKSGENAEVFVKAEGDKITGLTIIAAEPKELTIVHILGSIDPEQLGELGGHFGIPKMDKAPAKKAAPKSGKDEE